MGLTLLTAGNTIYTADLPIGALCVLKAVCSRLPVADNAFPVIAALYTTRHGVSVWFCPPEGAWTICVGYPY